MTDWLTGVEEVSLGDIYALREADGARDNRGELVTGSESYWVGWYEVENRGKVVTVRCLAHLASWEPQDDCETSVTRTTERAALREMEAHITRGCRNRTRLSYTIPKECPF